MNNIVTVINLNSRIRKRIGKSISELRTNIFANDKAGTSILFTSTCKSEGRSTISISLALSLSRCKRKVVWVNCDFRRKNNLISFCTEESAENSLGGLADYLNGERSIEEIIFKVSEEELHIIPCGNIKKTSSDLLETENFIALLTELKQAYDYVIIDCAATSEYVDSRIVASKCDSIVYIIRQGRTKREKIQHAIQELKKCNKNIIGAVLNHTK